MYRKTGHDIVTFNANKGGAVVTNYVGKSERQSNSKEHYVQLSKYQTSRVNETAKRFMERFQKDNIITNN